MDDRQVENRLERIKISVAMQERASTTQAEGGGIPGDFPEVAVEVARVLRLRTSAGERAA